MRSRFYWSVGVCVGVVAAVLAGHQAAPEAGDEPLTPVIVELFTSQGCSSCPPADDLLRSLERNQPVNGALIIPLSEHVDYWNRLGWRDPFSSRVFSERQRAYAESLGTKNVYTPMMVVDGGVAFVGSRPITAREAVVAARKVPKATLALEATMAPNGSTIRVEGVVTRLPTVSEQPGVWVAVTESQLTTEVTRGENASKTLTHTGVVRSLDWLGSLTRPPRDVYQIEGDVKLKSTWRRDRLRLVVFLQDQTSGRILGATQLPVG